MEGDGTTADQYIRLHKGNNCIHSCAVLDFFTLCACREETVLLITIPVSRRAVKITNIFIKLLHSSCLYYRLAAIMAGTRDSLEICTSFSEQGSNGIDYLVVIVVFETEKGHSD